MPGAFLKAPKVILYEGPNNVSNYSVLKSHHETGIKHDNHYLIGDRHRHKQRIDWTPGMMDEFGFGLDIEGGQHNVYTGFVSEFMWGDGAHVGYYPGKPTPRGHRLAHMTLANNRRNGLSVVAGEDLLIEHIIARDNYGIPTQAGFDFEPEVPNYPVKNIKFYDNYSLNNGFCGLLVDKGAKPSSYCSNFDIRRFVARQEGAGWAAWLMFDGGENTVRDSAFYGPIVYPWYVHFIDCRFFRSLHYPFAIEQFGDHPVRFTNCYVEGEALRKNHPLLRLLGSNVIVD